MIDPESREKIRAVILRLADIPDEVLGKTYVSPEALAEMDAAPIEPHRPFIESLRDLMSRIDDGPDCGA